MRGGGGESENKTASALQIIKSPPPFFFQLGYLALTSKALISSGDGTEGVCA